MSIVARSVSAGIVARDSATRRAICCWARPGSVTVTSPFAVPPSRGGASAGSSGAGASSWSSAIVAPIGSVRPSGTTITRRPACSDACVSVALSASISSSSSPRSTLSPSAFSQRTIVPSSIESESRGMTTTIISARD